MEEGIREKSVILAELLAALAESSTPIMSAEVAISLKQILALKSEVMG